MKSAVVDTNILSDLFRGEPSVRDFLREFESIYVPVTVLGELLFGFVLGTREAENRHRLDQFLSQRSVEVLPVSPPVAGHYASVMASLRRNGTPLPTNDVWIAASACAEKVPLISRDSHFKQIKGLQLIIPE
ncbi:MAG: type II toxin-antitoxin system VapC family toxin [Kiritimatiellales bacterium]|jgi:tRNA(fMet)-specific endonuclease VapC